jgi:acetoin:2,6-dichlorophenolindophenol oxidoreductase subunit beta
MTPLPTYSQAYALGVREEMLRDPTIIVLGTDLLVRGGNWAQILGLGAEFGPTRIIDTPISEAAMVAAGVGAAITGLRPIVDLNFIDFVFGAMDEVVNQAAKLRHMIGADVPVVIRATAGVAGGAQQHNNSLDMWFAQTPGLLVATPAFPADAKGLIKTALRGKDPVVFLMHKKLNGFRGEAGGEDDLVPFGRAEIRRPGTDLTIVAYSYMVHVALRAANLLAESGISAEVVDLRTLMPLDMATVEVSVRRTGRAMVLTDSPVFGSMASEVAASIQESSLAWLDAPVIRVGAGHSPVPHSPPLVEALVPDERAVAAEAQRLMNWSLG